MFKKYSLRYYNFRLAAAILATMLFGLLLVNSAKPSYTMKEAIGITGCFAVMIIISFIDYNWILKYFWLIYIVNIALLGAVLVFGHNGKGATRWIKIADGITLQPSEFTKLFLIL
ncbi:MAG TPA: rod shape-determining protein RodA, partial [Bacteroides sp.]|nr:rod shape-determining protein RodA [Bacteroides sp.]